MKFSLHRNASVEWGTVFNYKFGQEPEKAERQSLLPIITAFVL